METSIIKAIGKALRGKKTVFVAWAYSNNYLFVGGQRLAGEYRVVNEWGDIVAANEFVEIIG